MVAELERSSQAATAGGVTPTAAVGLAGMPLSWGHSSVSMFGVRYTPPLPDLSPAHSVEALVEDSYMSLLREGAFLPCFLKENLISKFPSFCRQPYDA